MRNKLILLFLLLLIIMGIAVNVFKNNSSRVEVCLKDHCFLAEVSLTEEERMTGLMFREKLSSEEAMLFIFPDDNYHSFWMKNVLFPLDIIWIDQNKKVVYLAENCQPCPELPCQSIKPKNKARYVLEVRGGTVQRVSLSIGEKLEFEEIN